MSDDPRLTSGGLLTAEQEITVVALINLLGVDEDGPEMRLAQQRFGAPDVPNGWRFWTRAQAEAFIADTNAFLARQAAKRRRAGNVQA